MSKHAEDLIGLMVDGQALASEDINLAHRLPQQVRGLPTTTPLKKSGLNGIFHMGLPGPFQTRCLFLVRRHEYSTVCVVNKPFYRTISKITNTA